MNIKMEIKIINSTIEVNGIIKTIKDSEMLINAIQDSLNNAKVFIRINDSFALSSSIIGELLKVKSNGGLISMEVKNETLYELLEDLNLISTFNVEKL